MFRGYLARRLYPRYTCETQLSPFVLTLGIPIMCKSHASFSRDGYSRDTCEKTFGLTLGIPVMCRAHVPFREMLSREIPAKTLLASNAWVFTVSLTITQPLQQIPTTNTGYTRLNKLQSNLTRNKSQHNTYLFVECPHLLPLHFHIIERLIAQTLTTPFQSVKWSFGTAGKHWKKPRMADATWSLLQDLKN